MSRQAYPACKPSGMDWVGDIPEHWDVRRVKYTASINDEVLSETTDPEFEVTYVDIGSVDAVKGIVAKEVYRFEDAPSRARRIVRDGDTIVSTVRTYLRAIAPIHDADGRLIVSTGFAVVRPRKLDPGYLSYALRAPFFVETVVSRSTGVSYPAINASEVGNIDITLPSLDEQRAIAAFLDRETARIDTLIEKKQRQIELLQEKRSALISHAVTKGLDPNVPMKDSGIEWLGEIPEHWEVWKAAHILRLYGGHAPESVIVAPEGNLYFKVEDLNQQAGEQYLFLHSSTLTVSTSTSTAAISPPLILIPKRGAAIATNKVRIATEPCLFDSNIMGIQVLRKCRVEYTAYTLLSRGLWDIADVSTIPQINNKHINPLKVPVPPPKEQQAIVEYIGIEAKRLDFLGARIHQSIDMLREYRTALISAAVTGRIDVRDSIEQRKKKFKRG